MFEHKTCYNSLASNEIEFSINQVYKKVQMFVVLNNFMTFSLK